MENGLNKHEGTLCSSMQKGVRTMVGDVTQTVKIGNLVNNECKYDCRQGDSRFFVESY